MLSVVRRRKNRQHDHKHADDVEDEAVAGTLPEFIERYSDPRRGSGEVLHQDEFAVDLPD
jgi:hypothetical protein